MARLSMEMDVPLGLSGVYVRLGNDIMCLMYAGYYDGYGPPSRVLGIEVYSVKDMIKNQTLLDSVV
jgi:hypothetical protein